MVDEVHRCSDTGTTNLLGKPIQPVAHSSNQRLIRQASSSSSADVKPVAPGAASTVKHFGGGGTLTGRGVGKDAISPTHTEDERSLGNNSSSSGSSVESIQVIISAHSTRSTSSGAASPAPVSPSSSSSGSAPAPTQSSPSTSSATSPGLPRPVRKRKDRHDVPSSSLASTSSVQAPLKKRLPIDGVQPSLSSLSLSSTTSSSQHEVLLLPSGATTPRSNIAPVAASNVHPPHPQLPHSFSGSESVAAAVADEDDILSIVKDELCSDDRTSSQREIAISQALLKLANLCNMTDRGQRNVEFFLGTVGIGTVLVLILKNPNSAKIQGAGAAFVLNVLNLTTNASAHTRVKEAMHRMGTLSVLILAMQTFVHDEKVQLYGCALLQKWTKDETDDLRVLVHSNGIEALVASMKHHPHDVRIQRLGCKTLGALCPDPAFRSRLLSVGAFSCLVAAGERHPNDPLTTMGALCAARHFIALLDDPSS